MLVPTGYWHSPMSILPVQELFSLNSENASKGLFSNLPTALRREPKDDLSILRTGCKGEKDRKKMGDLWSSPNSWYSKPEGRSVVFHWDTLNESRSEGGGGILNRRDDGVVLLVGLFNLLAVVVFVGHQLMTRELLNTNKRIIFWQIQKVLDELVLRVHSSETASNLLARALNSPTEEISGRSLNNKISSFINQMLDEKDPYKLQKTLQKTVSRLREEIFSPPNVTVGHISLFIYKPFKVFYRRLTEQSLRGRALSVSLLQEMCRVTKMFQGMTLSEIQSILRAMGRLGRIHQRYDLLSIIKNTIPTEVWKSDSPETRSELSSNDPRRSRRGISQHEELFRDDQRQRRNSRYLRFSKAQKKDMEDKSILEVTKTPKDAKDKPINKKGVVEDVRQETLVTNWADGWFTLLTQASPVALDISTLYARSGREPRCLRSFLCKANGNWRRKGTFQASLSPFLSVLVSWALEGVTPHSLGDSLIAVRAGWMGKACQKIFPECQHEGIPHSIVKQALKIFDNEENDTKLKDPSSSFLSKSGEYYHTDEPTQHNEKPAYTKMRDPPSTTTTTQPLSPQRSSTHQPPHVMLPQQNHSHNQEIHHFKPYNRYDQPSSQEGTFLPSGSIAGMALQDRPLERMDIGVEGEEEEEHSFEYLASKNHRFSASKTETNIRGSQANPFFNEMTLQPMAESSDYITGYIPRTIPLIKGERHNGPSILHQPDYSSYMALQQPLSTRQSHRNIIHQLNISPLQSLSDHDRSSGHKSKKPLKYKYGLRRGLPSRNVDGLKPLVETRKKVPKPFKINTKKKNDKGKETDNLINHQTHNMKAVINLRPKSATKNRKSRIKHHLDRKLITQFTYKDAITDPLKTELLYQYIRDRRLESDR